MAAAAEFTWSNAALQYEAFGCDGADRSLRNIPCNALQDAAGHLPRTERQGRAASVRRPDNSHAGDRQAGLLNAPR